MNTKMIIDVAILDVEMNSRNHKELEKIIEEEFKLYSIEWILNSKKYSIAFRIIGEESYDFITHEVKTKLIDTLLDFSDNRIQFRMKDNSGWHFNYNL